MKELKEERLVESLLEEWLGDQRPKQITLSSLEATRISAEDASRFDAALDAAAIDLSSSLSNSSLQAPTARTLASARSKKSASGRVNRVRRLQFVVQSLALALAACFVLALGLWSVNSPGNQGEVRIAGNNSASGSGHSVVANEPLVPNASITSKNAEDSVANQGANRNRTSKIGSDPRGEMNNPAMNGQPERLALDSVPFGSDSKGISKDKDGSSIATDVPSLSRDLVSDQPSKGLYFVASVDGAVVANVDKQFIQLWKKVKLVPTEEIDDDAWLERVTQQVLNRTATEDEHRALLQSQSVRRRIDRLNALLKSDEFSRVWSEKLVNFYLQSESLAFSNDDSRVHFQKWVEGRIKSGASIGEIARETLMARGSNLVGSGSYNPASYWWAEVLARRSDRPVSEHIYSTFLGTQTCNRCHKKSSEVFSTMERFWGLEAVTNGLDLKNVRHDEATGENSDKQSSERIVVVRDEWKPVFYEREDATLKTAIPMLPSGRSVSNAKSKGAEISREIESSITMLADEIVTDKRFDRSHVAFVWQSLFGLPIRSHQLLSDELRASDADISGEHVVDFLADQFRGQGQDLRKIIAWIVMTQPFSRESIPSKPAWYLTAAESDLESYRRRQSAFASFPARIDPSLRNPTILAQWLQKNKDSANKSDGVLGNILPQKGVGSPSSSKQSSAAITDAQVQFILRSQSLSSNLESEIQSLANSDLKWEQMVEHVYYFAGMGTPTQDIVRRSNQLLELNGDKASALKQLLTSLL